VTADTFLCSVAVLAYLIRCENTNNLKLILKPSWSQNINRNTQICHETPVKTHQQDVSDINIRH